MTAPVPDPLADRERLVRIETKLDAFLDGQRDHETRIRKLERALWTVASLTAAGGGGVAAIVTKLTGG